MNREIFNRASEAKKSNLIHRFFTRRGLVYVQRDDSSQPTSVHISDLNSLFPPNHSGNHRNGARGNRNDRQATNVQTKSGSTNGESVNEPEMQSAGANIS